MGPSPRQSATRLTTVNFRKLTPVDRLKGEDEEDTYLLHEMLLEARNYLSSYDWCLNIDETFFGLGIGGVVAVFLFRITPARQEIDRELWVVVGDLPPAYLVTEDAPNPACALAGYIGEMAEWARAVMEGTSVERLIPVNVPPTLDNALELRSRLDFLEKDILLAEYADDLTYSSWGQDVIRRNL